MLADGVAVRMGTTCERALLHRLRPAGAMPGFPLLSSGDCNEGDKAIGTLPKLQLG